MKKISNMLSVYNFIVDKIPFIIFARLKWSDLKIVEAKARAMQTMQIWFVRLRPSRAIIWAFDDQQMINAAQY